MENQITVTRLTGTGILRSVDMTKEQFSKYDNLICMSGEMDSIEEHDYYVEAIQFFNDIYTKKIQNCSQL